jgi:hypothetical protein
VRAFRRLGRWDRFNRRCDAGHNRYPAWISTSDFASTSAFSLVLFAATGRQVCDSSSDSSPAEAVQFDCRTRTSVAGSRSSGTTFDHRPPPSNPNVRSAHCTVSCASLSWRGSARVSSLTLAAAGHCDAVLAGWRIGRVRARTINLRSRQWWPASTGPYVGSYPSMCAEWSVQGRTRRDYAHTTESPRVRSNRDC